MNERRRRLIVAGVTGFAMLLMIGLVLGITLRGRGGPPVAPSQDINPTGRGTPRNGSPNFPAAPTATPGPSPTPLPAPPRGTVVYERSGTIYLLVLGAPERTLVPAGTQPKIAPDGSRVVYVGRAGSAADELLLVDTRTRGIVLLTDQARDPALPVWSPDEQRIAFRAAVNGTTEIFTVGADGTNLQQLTHGQTTTDRATQPAWAADGTTIYYKNQGDGAFYRIPAAGGVPTRIHAPNGQQYDLAPAPDGTSLAFTQRAPGDQEFALYMMNPDGTNARRVAPLPTITAPEQLGGLAWSPLGNAILVASGGAFREEVYDLRTARPTTAVAYGAWPSWIAAEITAP
ncbi:MAG: TolB family protein [Thermomicrobiales bacterium]